MSAEATTAVIARLLDHYPPEMHSKYGHALVEGGYKQAIDSAKEQTQKVWAATFGEQFRPFPETFGVAYELLHYGEQIPVLKLRDDISRTLTPKATEILAKVSQLQPHTNQWHAAPAYLKLQAYRKVFDFANYSPDLTVPEGIESGPHIPNEGLGRSKANAVCTFASNLLYYRPDSIMPPDFDGLAAVSAINSHEHGVINGHYRLAWMLGMLATPFATENRVRTITTIGCDFGEIKKRVLTPLWRRCPALQATLNVFIPSEDRLSSIHPVSIAGNTEDGGIIMKDPQHNEPKAVTAEDFWHQWTATNMQAAVTIATP